MIGARCFSKSALILFTIGAMFGCTSTSSTPSAAGAGLTTAKPVPFRETVWFDANGRPYDVPQMVGQRFTKPISKPVGRLRIDGSPIMVGDGTTLSIASEFAPTADEFVEVSFGDNTNEIDVLLLTDAARPETNGLRINLIDASPVDRWERFEDAYGTDGGVGAVTTKHVLERNRGKPSNYQPMDDYTVDVQLADNDELLGADSVVFSNGFGDGGFPMSRGVDAQGRLVALVIWTGVQPWRISVPDGTPPPDVREREQQLADCFSGKRKLVNDYCP